jgi:DNA polymerase-3 subunit delta'
LRFSEVIGQDAVKRRLIRTVKENRVSHAQLFLGQEGTGNLALAIAYSQYINCTRKTENDSCGECPSCIKFQKLVHPDLHFVYPTAKIKDIEKPVSSDFIAKWRELALSNGAYFSLTDWYEKIGIEKKQGIINANDCNNIIKTLSLRSYEADYQVVIIWMVEKLFHAAAPKLLKILEEPPDKTLFILVSENQEQIIKTIVSRSQIVKIPAIANDDIVSALVKEFPDPGQVHDAVKISDGSYLVARQHLLKLEEVEMNLKWFSKWMRYCFSGKYAEILDFVNEISKQSRDRQKNFLEYALRIFRQSLLISSGNEELAKLNREESEFVIGKDGKRFYPFINHGSAGHFATVINDAIYHIERNGQSGIIFFDLSLKLYRFMQASKSQVIVKTGSGR